MYSSLHGEWETVGATWLSYIQIYIWFNPWIWLQEQSFNDFLNVKIASIILYIYTVYIYKTHSQTHPLGKLSFASHFSPTSALCQSLTCECCCHNIHMLHFTSIWCVRCSETQNKHPLHPTPPQKTQNYCKHLSLCTPPATPKWWQFCEEENLIRTLCFAFSSHPTSSLLAA